MNSSSNQPHILGTSSNLMGICFILVTGFKLAKAGEGTIADEASMVAALFFLISCLFSYMAMRSRREKTWYEGVADRMFLVGLLVLAAAVLIFTTGIL